MRTAKCHTTEYHPETAQSLLKASLTSTVKPIVSYVAGAEVIIKQLYFIMGNGGERQKQSSSHILYTVFYNVKTKT